MTFQQAGLAVALLVHAIFSPTNSVAEDRVGRVTTVAVPRGGGPVAAEADRDGNVHLLYDAPEGPKYAKSADGGITFGSAVAVVGEAPRPKGLEFHGWDIAVGRDGRAHVAMGTNAWKLKLPKEEWGLFYANLDPGATAFSPVRNVNKTPSEGFSLAADDKGNVTACWLSGKLYANVSRDNGETFGGPLELNGSYNPCDCCTTSATYGADGRLAVLYREETNNDRDMHLVLWDQVAGSTVRRRVGTTPWKIDGCPMTYFKVSRTPSGFNVAWPTKGRVAFATLDGGGVPSGPAEVFTSGTSGMRTGMLALSAADGTTLVAWRDGGRIAWQVYGGDGRAIGAPGSAESQGKGVAGVVGNDGQFILYP